MNADVFIRGQANSAGAIAVTEDDNQLGQSSGVNLLFVDSSVDNFDALIAQVKQDTQVIVLNGESDGITQITDALSEYQNVSSLSVVSHGQSGQLQLGSSTISSAALSRYRDELQSWQGSLSDNADILFYGCNVAAGHKGETFLNQIGELTGADIAASTDLTGSSKLGGDWQLEFLNGQIETSSPFQNSVAQNYESVLQSSKQIFQNSGDTLDKLTVQSHTKHGVNVVNNPDGSGKVLRFDLRRTDPLARNKHRAEVRPKPNTPIEFGKNYTYSVRLYIPKDWKSDGSMEVVSQWHGVPDKHLGENFRNAPASFRISGNSFSLRQAWDADAVTNTKDKSSYGSRKTNLGPLTRGQWIDWTFEVRWSHKSDGVFRVFRDGELMLDRTGPNTFNDKEPPYAKFGIYKPDWTARAHKSSTSRRVLYADDYTITTGHQSKTVSSQSRPNAKDDAFNRPSLPTAKDDAFVTNEDTRLTGNVLTGSGADDAGSGTLKVVKNSKPGNGWVRFQEDGTFTYTPQANFFGDDTFSYTIENSQGFTDTATVTVTVKDINDRPTASGTIPTQKATDGSSVTLDVSSYFSDRDGTISSYTVNGLPEGLSINNKGIISGKIDSNASDAANTNAGSQDYTVTITAKDDDGATVQRSFQYAISNVDPVASNDVFTTNEDTPFTGNVLKGKGADVDGGNDSDSLSVISFSEPANGSLTIQKDGSFTYTPNANFSGKDTFTYTISDGNGGVDTATVTLTVNDTKSDLVEPTKSAPIEPKSFRIEAESLKLDTYRLESRGTASGGKLISLRGGKGKEVGTATYVHKGGSGTFDIDLRYFDENDGSSRIKVKLNGKQIDQWSLNAKTKGSNAAANTSRIYTIESITLADGDRLEIEGLENRREHVRIDYLDFKSVAPQPTPIRVEAEDLAVSTFRTESRTYASGGKVLSLLGKGGGEVGRATYTHSGAAGTYNLNLSYFDENDGVSTIKILLNGKQIDAWALDENPDGAPVSAQTERMRTISGLSLNEGDRLTIVGAENAGEHVRIDYLELTPALLQPLAA
ncbi:MAG: DUF4347 domain-containing protein [Synechococcus sp.]